MTNIVSYGGGTNSTAMIVEMWRRGEPIDAITFSDTGGEKPQTYAYLEIMNGWLRDKNLPHIEILKAVNAHGTLENELLSLGNLPPIVFGWKTCSEKWKVAPFRRWLRSQHLEDVTVCVGFDADERVRADRAEKKVETYTRRFPLLEWNMGREECMEAISAAALPLPGKSSCFFCPNSRKHEILALPDDLKKRALAMEANALQAGKIKSSGIKGLARNYSWADLINADEDQLKLSFLEMPCGCYDGK